MFYRFCIKLSPLYPSSSYHLFSVGLLTRTVWILLNSLHFQSNFFCLWNASSWRADVRKFYCLLSVVRLIEFVWFQCANCRMYVCRLGGLYHSYIYVDKLKKTHIFSSNICSWIIELFPVILAAIIFHGAHYLNECANLSPTEIQYL